MPKMTRLKPIELPKNKEWEKFVERLQKEPVVITSKIKSLKSDNI
jgi:hypothetical protein